MSESTCPVLLFGSKMVLLYHLIRNLSVKSKLKHVASLTIVTCTTPFSAHSYLSVEQDHLPPEMLPSVIEELQKRVSLAEETIEHKEKENLALREQVQQSEARWLEYESKMKSMEEMWQKQMASLQVSFYFYP